MRYVIAMLTAVALIGGTVMLAQNKKAPAKLVFESKTGKVTYDHAAHDKREKDDCTVCHDKLWPQFKAPLNFKLGMHKPSEAKKASCASCHVAGGKAFESKGNCNKCHAKAAAK
jgi:c(7)-type cytochrome triheme protein